MRNYFHIILLGLLVTACKTTKDAATTARVVSSADYPYIEKFHEGVRLKTKGQVKDAIAAFEFCFAANPNDDAVAFALSQCYLMEDQRMKAAEFTEKASKLDPDNIWYTQELAYMYFEQNRLEEARKCFDKMIDKEPTNIDWLYGYAEVLKRLGKKQEAIKAYDEMEAQLGLLPDLSIQKFDLYLSMKQDEKALNELNKARKMYPDDLSLIGTLVDYYFQKRDIQKAKDMLGELVRANPSNGRANLALADLFMRENNKKEAYKYFKAAFTGEGVDIDTKMNVLLTFYEQQVIIDPEVLELGEIMVIQHPNDAKSHSILGDFSLKNNDKNKALASYKKALELDESKFPIWNQVLILEYQQRQFKELYTDARACSALFPTVASVQLLYTIACVQTGRYTEAIDAADMGRDLVVNDPMTEAEFHAQQGEAYFWLKNATLGAEHFEKALSLDPSNHLTKNNYAMQLALNKRELAKANTMIDEIIAQYPNQAPFMDTKGVILFQEGKFTEAKQQFEAAFALIPDDPNYADHLGDAWVKLGNAEKALTFWKQAKTLGSINQSLDKKIQNKQYYAPVY